MKKIQRRIEKKVGNCNGKYDRMVNHHFAPLILRPRGNRACFIQQFIRSPSILALKTLSPRRYAVHRGLQIRPAAARPVCRPPSYHFRPPTEQPNIITDCLQTEPTSLQFPFMESSIAAVSTNPPNITHRKRWRRGTEAALREGLGTAAPGRVLMAPELWDTGIMQKHAGHMEKTMKYSN